MIWSASFRFLLENVGVNSAGVLQTLLYMVNW